MIKNVFVLAALFFAGVSGFAQTGGSAPLHVTPAHAWRNPDQSMLLDVERAGSRIVAVGEHGIVLLSDDGGTTFRQARVVPASGTLSAVHFVDAQHGWAVGQSGVILMSDDGGETWALQRSDTSVDQPLYSVYFKDARHGWVVGLWSLMLSTSDGGETWNKIMLPAPPGGGKADLNLYKIFANHEGHIFVAAEQGTVIRSRNNGVSWEYRETGNKGSFWAGTVADDDSIYVGGLLGHLYRSTDDGESWARVESGSSGSITELVSVGTEVVGVGLDGFVITGNADSGHFTAYQRRDRAALTGVMVAGKAAAILLSKDGIVKAE
ncbi:WD40/YVTN/BNR-like repeat-containing protein [Paraburkholderia megapolitana]|uniref:WD40/YVTN/BNR-like repeat-containing protein n=1 Tax=Paraburkholderia megapolitana TaxID=420953 RepID=UPI0038B6EBDB